MLSIIAAIAFMAAVADADAAPPLDDATIARLSHRLLDRAGTLEELEVAAFIVRPLGRPATLVYWTKDRMHRRAEWRGPIPGDAIAVIHTHPHAIPRPSSNDAAEARRLRLPFYVVSRRSLFVAHADGRLQAARTIPWLRRDAEQASSNLRWRDVPS